MMHIGFAQRCMEFLHDISFLGVVNVKAALQVSKHKVVFFGWGT